MKYENKPGTYYSNYRPEMQQLFPETTKTFLDVGCGNGTMAAEIKAKHNVEAWGVEYMDVEAEKAKDILDYVFSGTIEDNLRNLPDNYFDVIYFNDVLEHLTDPYNVLSKIKDKLTSNGVIISSIPNIRYHGAMRSYLFNKDWKYEDYGVMDFTHYRFFTSKSIIRMYQDAGYKIVSHKGINKSKSLKPYLLNLLFFGTFSDIFYSQFATVVRK